MQFDIKEQIKYALGKKLPDSQLSVFRFPADKKLQKESGVRWYEENEFSYKGNMYDVVSRQQDGKYIVFKCINDSQENVLFAGLSKQVKNAMDNDNTKSKTLHLLQKFNLLYCTQKSIDIVVLRKKYQLFFPPSSLLYHNLSIEIITPPPQIG